MASLYLRNLAKAVQATAGCECEHIGPSTVHEMMEGETVWRGTVERFTLKGHPKTDKAFAWGWKDAEGEIRYIAVLGVPSINSPREAVQAAIASKTQR